jgi:DNA-binding transcriptional ArsR family regulator
MTENRAHVSRVHVVAELDDLQVLLHPLRIEILDALREPAAGATIARRLGQPRQKVNYHLKELERAGLVETAGERRAGNFVETLYRAVASTFVVSPRAAWLDPRRVDALQRQHSLERLVAIGDRLQRDAVALLDRAAFDGEEIASATVEADVHFADETARAAFLREYFDFLRELCDRYGARSGVPYRVVVAAHPAADEPREA